MIDELSALEKRALTCDLDVSKPVSWKDILLSANPCERCVEIYDTSGRFPNSNCEGCQKRFVDAHMAYSAKILVRSGHV